MLLFVVAGEFLFGFVWTVISIFLLGFALVHSGSNYYVRVMRDLIEVDAYLFSFLAKQFRFSANQIDAIETKVVSSTSRNGKVISEQFGLIVVPRQGKAFSIGGDFPSLKIAYHYKQEIERVLGLL